MDFSFVFDSALVIWAGAYFYGASQQGHTTSDHQLIGSVVATILVIVVTVQIALDTAYWTVFNHITIWGSLVWYFALQYFYNFVIGGSYVGSLTKVTRSYSIVPKRISRFNDSFSPLSGHGRSNVLVHSRAIHRHFDDSGGGVEVLLRRCPPNAVGSRSSQAKAFRHSVRFSPFLSFFFNYYSC